VPRSLAPWKERLPEGDGASAPRLECAVATFDWRAGQTLVRFGGGARDERGVVPGGQARGLDGVIEDELEACACSTLFG
jgi:hypothetical protein